MNEPNGVEIVLALPGDCHRVWVTGGAAHRAGDAVTASGLDRLCQELTGQWPSALGIHGRRIDADYRPAAGERIEILRPLEIDPKAARRARAARAGE